MRMMLHPASKAILLQGRQTAAWQMLTLIALLCLLPLHLRAAPYCSLSSSPTLDFGAVSATSYQDAQTSLTLNCNGGTGTLLTAALVRVCLFVGTGTAGAVGPRLMSNGAGALMRYDLYADAARSKLVGPHSSGYPLYSISFKIAPRENQSIRIPIYGRVPAGQNLPAGTLYRDIPYGSYVRYSYGYIHAPTESNCRDRIPGHVGGAGDISFNWSGVQASILRSCRISTLNTLDFGIGAGLRSGRERSITAQLKCTAGAAWQVNLDDGLHALAGKRFMAAGGERVGYELYSDPSHLSRWGNTQSSGVSGTGTGAMQELTVYGLVPAKADALPGTYLDTVTMTLTY